MYGAPVDAQKPCVAQTHIYQYVVCMHINAITRKAREQDPLRIVGITMYDIWWGAGLLANTSLAFSPPPVYPTKSTSTCTTVIPLLQSNLRCPCNNKRRGVHRRGVHDTTKDARVAAYKRLYKHINKSPAETLSHETCWGIKRHTYTGRKHMLSTTFEPCAYTVHCLWHLHNWMSLICGSTNNQMSASRQHKLSNNVNRPWAWNENCCFNDTDPGYNKCFAYTFWYLHTFRVCSIGRISHSVGGIPECAGK